MHPILDPTLCIWERAIVEGTIAAAEIAQIIPPILLKPIPNEHQQANITRTNFEADTKWLERIAEELYDLRAAAELAISALDEVLQARAELQKNLSKRSPLLNRKPIHY